MKPVYATPQEWGSGEIVLEALPGSTPPRLLVCNWQGRLEQEWTLVVRAPNSAVYRRHA